MNETKCSGSKIFLIDQRYWQESRRAPWPFSKGYALCSLCFWAWCPLLQFSFEITCTVLIWAFSVSLYSCLDLPRMWRSLPPLYSQQFFLWSFFFILFLTISHTTLFLPFFLLYNFLCLCSSSSPKPCISLKDRDLVVLTFVFPLLPSTKQVHWLIWCAANWVPQSMAVIKPLLYVVWYNTLEKI